jgi:hypothetical protein
MTEFSIEWMVDDNLNLYISPADNGGCDPYRQEGKTNIRDLLICAWQSGDARHVRYQLRQLLTDLDQWIEEVYPEEPPA